jgi:Ca2+-binding RTX toxin-like protein
MVGIFRYTLRASYDGAGDGDVTNFSGTSFASLNSQAAIVGPVLNNAQFGYVLPSGNTIHAYGGGAALRAGNAGYYFDFSMTGYAATFIGGDFGDDLRGGSGLDTLRGMLGADRLAGGGGEDILDGGKGDDTLLPGYDEDSAFGGAGNDLFVYEAAGETSGDQVDGGAGTDRVRFASVVAGDTLTITAEMVNLETADLASEAGVRTGTTALNLSATAAPNALTILGNNGANALLGTRFADTIYSTGGADRINGGNGADAMSGGGGNDVFLYRTSSSSHGSTADVIRDFDDFGNDRIDLSSLYSGVLTWRGAGAITGPHQVHIRDVAGPDVLVEVNLTGSLAPDLTVHLAATTAAAMTANDFVL